MKSGFVPGLLVGFVLAAGAMGWFTASQKIFSADEPLIKRKSGTEYIYFAATADGRMIKLMPLNEPNTTTAALVSWVSQAMTESVQLQRHYETAIHAKSPARLFSAKGWEDLQQYMRSKGWTHEAMGTVSAAQTAPTAAPKVLKSGVKDGVYHWQVLVPMVTAVTEGRQQSRSENHAAVVTIARSPEVDSPQGIIITSVEPVQN